MAQDGRRGCLGYRWVAIMLAKIQPRSASRPRTRYRNTGLILTRREGGVCCRGANKLHVRPLLGGWP